MRDREEELSDQPTTEGYRGSSEKLFCDITWKREEEKEEIHRKRNCLQLTAFKGWEWNGDVQESKCFLQYQYFPLDIFQP